MQHISRNDVQPVYTQSDLETGAAVMLSAAIPVGWEV